LTENSLLKGSALSSIAAALESYFCNTVSEMTGLRNSNSSRFGGGVRRVNREKFVPASQPAQVGVQEEGGEKHEIKPGDVIWTPPGVKHWHGATVTTSMSHIAITNMVDGGNPKPELRKAASRVSGAYAWLSRSAVRALDRATARSGNGALSRQRAED
jgi:hypothetical protein